MKGINLKNIVAMEKATLDAKSSYNIWKNTERDSLKKKYSDEWEKLNKELHESSDYKKVYDAIRENDPRSKERYLTVQLILDNLIQIEKELKVTKKAMNGIKIHADIHAQSFPRSYKYTPYSTHFDAEFKNGNWILTNISREKCGTVPIRLYLTEECKKAITERYETMNAICR